MLKDPNLMLIKLSTIITSEKCTEIDWISQVICRKKIETDGTHKILLGIKFLKECSYLVFDYILNKIISIKKHQ